MSRHSICVLLGWLTCFGCGGDDVATDAGTDGSVELDAGFVDAGEETDAGDPTRIYHVDPGTCASRSTATATEEEDRQWQAARMTVPAGTVVGRIGYLLDASDQGMEGRCDPGLAHAVQLFVVPSDAEALPATPEVLAEIAVPDAVRPMERTEFEHVVSPSITVPEGHDLVVSMQMRHVVDTEGRLTCPLSCDGEDYGTSTFWSGAAETPYAWVAIAEYLIHSELGVWVAPPR